MRTCLTPQIPLPAQRTAASMDLFEIKEVDFQYLSQRSEKAQQGFEIIWVTNGNFQFMVELESFEMLPGRLLLMTPGQTFHLTSASSDIFGISLRFTNEYLPGEEHPPYPNLAHCTSRMFEIDEVTVKVIGNIILGMRGEFTNSHYRQMDVLSAYLKILFIYLFRQKSVSFRSSFRADMPFLVKKFFDLLERDFYVNKRVSEYANRLAVTPNYLNQIVRHETGLTASENIQKRLILQAKRMALLQNENLKTIAFKLGFTDAAHFSKFFKKGCGCCFTDYRKIYPIS